MHEVALSQQLYRVVARAAGTKKVRTVHLQIGALRQVVPESLTHAWHFVTDNTPLAGATLAVDWIPAYLTCTCGWSGTIEGDFSLLCPTCGLPATIVQGEQFTVTHIDVDT